MKRTFLVAVGLAALFCSTLWQVAEAQDAVCAKVKNPKHRRSCDCFVSGGGYSREEGGGKIRWYPPRSGPTPQIQDCVNGK